MSRAGSSRGCTSSAGVRRSSLTAAAIGTPLAAVFLLAIDAPTQLPTVFVVGRSPTWEGAWGMEGLVAGVNRWSRSSGTVLLCPTSAAISTSVPVAGAGELETTRTPGEHSVFVPADAGVPGPGEVRLRGAVGPASSCEVVQDSTGRDGPAAASPASRPSARPVLVPRSGSSKQPRATQGLRCCTTQDTVRRCQRCPQVPFSTPAQTTPLASDDVQLLGPS